MLIELRADQFWQTEAFFKDELQYIPALSVIRGDFPGKVFVDQMPSPHYAIVWALGRWMYLGGEEGSHALLKGAIIDALWGEVRQLEPETFWFEIYTKEDQEWEREFDSNTSALSVSKHYESVYTLDVQKFASLSTMENTDPHLLCEIKDVPILPEGYPLPSSVRQDFREKRRPGVQLVKEDQVIALCKNNGFEAESFYFIDVDTFEEKERGKGYATFVSQRLIQHTLEQGHVPLWETTHQNIASHKLACKLGFEPQRSYPVYRFTYQG